MRTPTRVLLADRPARNGDIGTPRCPLITIGTHAGTGVAARSDHDHGADDGPDRVMGPYAPLPGSACGQAETLAQGINDPARPQSSREAQAAPSPGSGPCRHRHPHRNGGLGVAGPDAGPGARPA